MTVVLADQFSKVYKKVVDEIISLMPEDWSSIAKHNIGWRRESFDAKQYLLDSEIRFLRAFEILVSHGSKKNLDVGGFLAAFPLTLKKLGFNVAVAEKFSYYDHALDRIANYLTTNDIEVIDVDFTEEGTNINKLSSSFDTVTCMAVAEHLAHSPKGLMENIYFVIKPGGSLVFEVPNLAYWPRRFAFFFKGKTVLPPIEDVFYSAIPFTGHHREYTLDDARYVIKQGGFKIISEKMFNYGIDTRNFWQFIKYAPALLFKEWAGIILLHCRKS